MGLGINGFNFLKYCSKNQYSIGKVLTLGRQRNDINWKDPDIKKTPIHIEKILKKEFNAISVDSLDASPYENASIIHDLNSLLIDEKKLINRFDTILDLGLIEHVFNVPNALSNIKKLCKLGGQIIHVQIHNDHSGHGFWQFSPELFFSWYSNLNGFSDTEIYIVDIKKPNYWVKCEKPSKGKRINLEGKRVPYSMILVYTKKFKDTSSDYVYQSDYEYLWNKFQNENNKSDSEIIYLEDIKSRKRNIFSKIKLIINPYKFIFYFLKLINKISFKPWYKSNNLLRKRKEYFFKLKKN